MNRVTLPPELERFAEDAVAAGVSLLGRQEQAHSDFVASLDAAIAQGERDGFFTIEQAECGMDAAIEEVLEDGR